MSIDRVIRDGADFERVVAAGIPYAESERLDASTSGHTGLARHLFRASCAINESLAWRNMNFSDGDLTSSIASAIGMGGREKRLGAATPRSYES